MKIGMTGMMTIVTKKEKHFCPICGKHEYEDAYSYEICPICGWEDDEIQELYPDETGANSVTLIEAREAWAKGITVAELEGWSLDDDPEDDDSGDKE